MNVILEIFARLPSGAKIEVTKEQNERITEFAEKILFSQTEKRTRKTILGAQRWTPDQDAILTELFGGKTSKEVKDLKTIAARKLGRTPSAVYVRWQNLSKNKGQATLL